MDSAPGRRRRRVRHVFGEHLLWGVDQDVGVLGFEGEVQIEPGERVLEFADRLATTVAPGDAQRMQERQFDRPVLGEQGGGVLAARDGGEEFEQPADIVLLCAYAINNVHLMLLSGVGEPYDPVAQKGVIGKNYCYQTGAGATLFFEGRHFNPFMSAGGSNATIDDFNINGDFDRGKHGFVGGYNVAGGFNTALPIGYRPVPRGTPQWGKAWKAATAKWYQTAMNIGASGSVMANRYNYYDLDPTYRNAFGQPLMRMTFDYKENEHKIGQHAAQVINDIAKSMNPTRLNEATVRTRWTVVPYQSTHNTGGTIMGANPRDSALNKYLQSWDCHNLFVVGANVFPHNASYNPTGPVGALAYWTADAVKNRYFKDPGPLVPA